MRPHGRATVDVRNPRAHAICERCGFRYNHSALAWEYQWQGPRLQNLKHLVCPSCLDVPQEGLRVIVLPPDPVPIMNARPEDFTDDNNPISGIGFDPRVLTLGPNLGVMIGTMTECGGLLAAFDNMPVKPAWRCARTTKSINGMNNTVGCNWNNDPASVPLPTALSSATQNYSIKSVTVNAPSDQPFLSNSSSISASFQGTNDGVAWLNLWSGVTAGSVGEALVLGSSNGLVMTNYAQHRLVLSGDGLNIIAVAQLTLTAAGPSGAQAAGIET